MCDTFVALGNTTKDGSVIFGKNSDRMISEAQLITYAPRKRFSKGDELKCTYISIPQVSETNAVILSQPYWIWGAEMGANEFGVVIGNEAILTKEPLKDTGLIGMDLLRLGLERGKSAKEALNIIIELLEEYGQGGAHQKQGGNYHNSMIITDPTEAYVLETAGEWWIVEFIKDFRSISNDITIRGRGDLRRDGIVQHAVEKGYCKDDSEFDFAITFSSPQPFPSYLDCSMSLLNTYKGEITVSLMMEFLREHKGNICRHKRKDLTAGSQVSSIKKERKNSIHWFTGSILPCLSIFKPYIFPIKNQHTMEAKPYLEIEPDWFWKRHLDFVKPYILKPNKENLERDDYNKKLRDVEFNLTRRVDEIFSKENELSDIEFINQIENLNQEAWKNSEMLIS